MFTCDSITWKLHIIENTTLLEALHVQLVTDCTCTYFELRTINDKIPRLLLPLPLEDYLLFRDLEHLV